MGLVMLATLFNTPTTPEGFFEFSFANQDQHNQIVFQLHRAKGKILQQYPLDPIPMNDVAGWLEIHQTAHAEFTMALGINGNDLSDVDFTNPDQVAAWTRLHALEHYQAAQILGIG